MTAGAVWSRLATLGDTLVDAASRWPTALAAVDDRDDNSYTELVVAAEVIAHQLLDAGLGPGSRVALLMPNSVAAVQAIFGCTFVGALTVVVNSRFSTRELRHVLEDANPDLVIVSGMRNERVDFEFQLAAALPEGWDSRVLVAGPPSTRGYQQLIVDPSQHSSVVAARVDEARAVVPLRSPALMIYTSGTTAMPKGCVLSHESLVRTATSIGRFRLDVQEGERIWAPLPVFHIGFFIPLIAALDAGGAIVTHSHFDAQRACDAVISHRVTITWAAFPALNDGLLRAAGDNGSSLGDLRVMLSVAPPDTMRKLQDAMPGATVIGCYGSTEVGGVCAVTELQDDLTARSCTHGRPLPGVQIVTINPLTAEELEPGTEGEIAVRGWSTFDGYWNDEAQTAKVMNAAGFVRTGDLGIVDREGRVTFTGRLKDMIKVGGENVAALEIESVLVSHRDIAVAAVVGVPDERLGEVPAAFVELAAGRHLAEEQVLEYCKSQLARYKVPRYVRFRTTWPMSATKIRKRDLARDLSRELDGPVAQGGA